MPEHSRTIVTSDARLTRYSSGEGELYDLADDRAERHNRYADPTADELRSAMADRLTDALLAAADVARVEAPPTAN